MFDLTSLETVQALLKKYHLRPNTDIGQHFLIRHEPIEQILAAGEVTQNDMVLEIGPGFGTLTIELARRAGRVIAVEKDGRLASTLRDILKQERIENVEVIDGDIMRMTANDFFSPPSKGEMKEGVFAAPATPSPNLPLTRGRNHGGYKLISNLPYQITSAVLRKFLEHGLRPEVLAPMVQKEVAERVTARPGKMSILSVSVQFYADAQIVSLVSKKNFYPMPEVDSAIMKIVPKPILPMSVDEVRNFFWLVRVGFSARRKMLKNNLAAGFRVSHEEIKEFINLANIKQNIRAQELSMEDWIRLYKICQKSIDKKKDF